MSIEAYFNQIKADVDRYIGTRFVLDANINFDNRPGQQGYVNGVIQFGDGSVLYFKEYLDAFKGTVDKLMYSYHYHGADNRLRFRYDNALHKPSLPFLEHKHLPDQIVEAPAPTLAEVLAEICRHSGLVG